MGINLQKGQRIAVGLQKVVVGLGWDPNEGASKFSFDLDATAAMLGVNGKVPDEKFFVFYNNQISKDGALQVSEDDTTGGKSDGDDDETIDVDLSKASPLISSIVFSASIHEFEVRKQNFGQVQNSYIRICNAANGEELCKFELSEDFSTESAIEFGRLYLKDGAWKFEATGVGHKNGLQSIVDKYL